VASLIFKGQYVAPIQTGEKTTTLRASRPKFEPGTKIEAWCRWGDPPFAELICTELERVELERITDPVARADGFEDAAELRDELAQLYPGVESFWLIRFERGDRQTSASPAS
jgi:hypothetical protein